MHGTCITMQFIQSAVMIECLEADRMIKDVSECTPRIAAR